MQNQWPSAGHPAPPPQGMSVVHLRIPLLFLRKDRIMLKLREEVVCVALVILALAAIMTGHRRSRRRPCR